MRQFQRWWARKIIGKTVKHIFTTGVLYFSFAFRVKRLAKGRFLI